MQKKPTLAVYVTSILLALTHPVCSQSSLGEADFITTGTQPANVGDAAAAAIAYRASGAYETGLATVDEMAADWLRLRAPHVDKPAMVLDVDETALSNWNVIIRDDFGRPIAGRCDLALDAPCGWAAWDQLGRDPVIKPTLSLFEVAKDLNVAVFFITGRPEGQRAATERNLINAGYVGYRKLYMVPDGLHFASATDFKAPVRAEVEREGFTVIANIGDQPSDLLGGHSEKKFLLPDPFYRVP